MGFFDRILGKGRQEQPVPTPAGGLPRAELAAAAGHLAAGRKAEALAMHEALVAAQPDSGELLAAISADLGRNGCLEEMLTLITPVYDAGIHGPEAGINLIQACLHRGDADGAQMWIDVLSALDRPDLVERLAGFNRAAAELRASATVEAPPPVVPRKEDSSINLVSISRPLWSYSVPAGEALLPEKQGRLRTIAIATFAAAGPDPKNPALEPGHVANLWARAFPFAIAEALAFAPTWQPKAMAGIIEGNKLFTPPVAFGLEQVRGLYRGGKDASDYAITGTLTVAEGRIGVRAEIFDVSRDRSMKTFVENATVAQAGEPLAKVFGQLRNYLEASTVVPGPVAYAPPASMTERLVALDHALTFFLVDKGVVPAAILGDAGSRVAELDAHAAASPGDPIAPLLAEGARAIHDRLQAG